MVTLLQFCKSVKVTFLDNSKGGNLMFQSFVWIFSSITVKLFICLKGIKCLSDTISHNSFILINLT